MSKIRTSIDEADIRIAFCCKFGVKNGRFPGDMDVRVWSDRHWSFWRCGAGSVGVFRLESRGICRACRFVPRSWSGSVYSSKTFDYLGALWEIVRVDVATLLVKEWMIILTVFLHVLHCIGSIAVFTVFHFDRRSRTLQRDESCLHHWSTTCRFCEHRQLSRAVLKKVSDRQAVGLPLQSISRYTTCSSFWCRFWSHSCVISASTDSQKKSWKRKANRRRPCRLYRLERKTPKA